MREKLFLVGEVISEQEADRLTAINQTDIDTAIAQWQQTAPPRYTGILQAKIWNPQKPLLP